MTASRSRLVVLAGPTAVGKGTVADCVRRTHPEIWISVSATTRPPRPGEVEGQHYHFVSDAEFDELVADGGMLEWAVVHGRHRYGTPRGPVEERLASGEPALLEIDLQGARQVRASMPDALLCFLKPPSFAELERRLVGRGTEDEAERARRLLTAREELAAEAEFDVTIVNTDVESACLELVDLFSSRARLIPRSPTTEPTPDSIDRREALVTTTSSIAEGITNPPIDDLLEKTDSKYKLVLYSAKRARQINAYYSQLGEGLLEYVGPLLETHAQEKPLSIALREINEDLLTIDDSPEPETAPAAPVVADEAAADDQA